MKGNDLGQLSDRTLAERALSAGPIWSPRVTCVCKPALETSGENRFSLVSHYFRRGRPNTYHSTGVPPVQRNIWESGRYGDRLTFPGHGTSELPTTVPEHHVSHLRTAPNGNWPRKTFPVLTPLSRFQQTPTRSLCQSSQLFFGPFWQLMEAIFIHIEMNWSGEETLLLLSQSQILGDTSAKDVSICERLCSISNGVTVGLILCLVPCYGMCSVFLTVL